MISNEHTRGEGGKPKLEKSQTQQETQPLLLFDRYTSICVDLLIFCIMQTALCLRGKRKEAHFQTKMSYVRGEIVFV